jgi:pyrroloquinoline quinone (PQQ) biosynthesis protein C
MTLPRARLYAIHLAHYTLNRRDCWGYVQGAAPLPVKRLVWAHEQDELIHDPRAGTDHFTLSTREAEVLGLTAAQVEQAELIPAATSAFYAWIHIAKSGTWLEAFAASSILERRNDDSVIVGGGLSGRLGRKMAADLDIPLERLKNSTVHMAADQEHASLLEQIAETYATTEEARQALLRGARQSMLVDRAFRGALAEAMEDLD